MEKISSRIENGGIWEMINGGKGDWLERIGWNRLGKTWSFKLKRGMNL